MSKSVFVSLYPSACAGANVPSTNAALYGNAGLAPIPAPGDPSAPR